MYHEWSRTFVSEYAQYNTSNNREVVGFNSQTIQSTLPKSDENKQAELQPPKLDLSSFRKMFNDIILLKLKGFFGRLGYAVAYSANSLVPTTLVPLFVPFSSFSK